MKKGGVKIRTPAAGLFIILLAAALTGCVGPDSDEDSAPSQINAPVWNVGHYWIYTFSTPDIQNTVCRMVVAPDDGTNHLVGAASLYEAQLHAVLNFNPVLGRVKLGDYSVYEKGKPQPLFSFPLKEGKAWNYSFLDVDRWDAKVTSIQRADIPGSGKTNLAYISATGSGGEKLDYIYDSSAGWLRSMTFVDSVGTTRLQMTMVSCGEGYNGTVYFIRAGDLFDREYTSTPGSPVADVYDTFVDQGHPKYGPWDHLIYFLNIDTKDNSGGSVAFRDHAGETAFQRTIGPDTNENTLGSIPSESGNWTVVTNLDGNAYLRVRIAGGITYSWDVRP